MLTSWVASHLAHRLESVPLQYGAYALLVVAQALIFASMILLAMATQPGVIEGPATLTSPGLFCCRT